MSLSSSSSLSSPIILLAKRKIGSDDDTTFQTTTTKTNKTLRTLKSTRQDTNIQYHSKRIRSSRSTTSSRFLTSILLILFLSSCSIPFPFQNKHPIGFANAAEDDKCASELSYTCPNCGGTQISDCLDCDGFLNTGEFICLLFVVCCLLFVVCCLLFICLLFVVCCLLFVVCLLGKKGGNCGK